MNWFDIKKMSHSCDYRGRKWISVVYVSHKSELFSTLRCQRELVDCFTNFIIRVCERCSTLLSLSNMFFTSF